MSNRVNGVRFDGLHSYYDFGLWMASRPVYGNPNPKINKVEVPGADGDLDMTEANSGEVKYTNRAMVLTFAAMVDIDEQADFMARIMSQLHGKRIERIVFDENPEWYFSGRASVSFSDVESWRLQCVIEVDAAPYAMRIDETVISLVGGDHAENIILRAVGVSSGFYKTDIRLGSVEFPDGLVSHGTQEMILRWPVGTGYASNRKFDVFAANGEQYSATITAPISDGEFRVDFEDIEHGISDLSTVYLIRVTGLEECSLFVDMPSSHFRVWNERKTVYPFVQIVANGDVPLTVNGKSVVVPHDGGTEQTVDGFVLRQGWNEIYIAYDNDLSITRFDIRFREGRL